MRSEREKYIAGFDHKKSIGNIITTRSEQTPNLKHERLKGIINTENYLDAKRDTLPSPVKDNRLHDDVSQSDYQKQLIENPFASMAEPPRI